VPIREGERIGKVVPVLNESPSHDDVVGSQGIVPRIPILDPRCRWVVSFTPRQLDTRERQPDTQYIRKMAVFYQTTRRYNPEDSYLRTHRRENLKSYLIHKELGEGNQNMSGPLLLGRIRIITKVEQMTVTDLRLSRKCVNCNSEYAVYCQFY
jgi:hypothetical protein